jgi:hypothetical protein
LKEEKEVVKEEKEEKGVKNKKGKEGKTKEEKEGKDEGEGKEGEKIKGSEALQPSSSSKLGFIGVEDEEKKVRFLDKGF